MKTATPRLFVLQAVVFSLVAASFTTIYLVQPILPELQKEFGVPMQTASATVSVVILGIAISNLIFGKLADMYSIKPLLGLGGCVVTTCGILCALSNSLWQLISLRLVQGLFIPALTTCIAAYLARTLPQEKLNTVMGSYVAATVIGGLGGRLVGGLLHAPDQWRESFLTVSALVAGTTLAALLALPKEPSRKNAGKSSIGYLSLLKRPVLLRNFFTGFAGMAVFASLFNYLPFHLAAEPFNAGTQTITMMYFAYLLGVFAAPLSGKISNRFGNGATILAGSGIFATALLLTLIPNLIVVGLSLALGCTGFFAIHASAVGSLNRHATQSPGRANAIYILCYYLGGSIGITMNGWLFQHYDWLGFISGCMMLLAGTTVAGLLEIHSKREKSNLD